MRRVLVFLICGLVLASSAPSGATANDHRRAIIVWASGLTAHDLVACDDARRSLCALGERGTVTLVSTRTASEDRGMRAASASSGATIAAEAHEEATLDGAVIGKAALGRFKASVGLHAAFRIDRYRRPDPGPPIVAAGIPFATLEPGEPVAAAKAVLRASRRRCCAVLVDAGTLEFARSREAGAVQRVDDTLRDVDRLIGALVRRAPRDTSVVVVSAVPPKGRLRPGVFLSVVAVHDRAGPGVFRSPTTRRLGVVTLSDLGASIGGSSTGEGRRWFRVPVRAPGVEVSTLESELVHARLARFDFTRRAMASAMVVVLLAGALLLAWRGRAGSAPAIPRLAREVVVVALLAIAALPPVLFVEGALHSAGVDLGWTGCALAALALALVARAAFGPFRGLIAISVVSAVVPLADLLAGEPLAYRSPWGYQIAGGGRFYGINEGTLGSVLGAFLLVGSFVLDRARDRRKAFWLVLAAGALAAWIMGSPFFGAKFGAPLTATPAIAVLLVKAMGRRLGLKMLIVVAAATVAVTGVMVAADRLLPGTAETHIARVTEGETATADLIARKIQAQIRITRSPTWTPVVVLVTLVLLVIRWRRRDGWDRALQDRPALRAAIVACAIGAVCGLLFNDGGIVASAPLMLAAATGALVPMIEPAR